MVLCADWNLSQTGGELNERYGRLYVLTYRNFLAKMS